MIDVIAVGGAVAGSAIVAANIGLAVYGYSLFLASSVASVVILRHAVEVRSIMFLNIFFVVINTVGIIRNI